MPVLVSGGGSGIGAAMVAAFAGQGSRVAFLEIDKEAALATAAALSDARHRPIHCLCDLRDVAKATEAAAELALEAGPFRALLNNAGSDEAHDFDTVDVDYWNDRVAVNLRHQFFLAQAVARAMSAAGGGSIVNLGSISWRIGAAGVPVYAIVKSAVEGLTKTLARELGVRNIRVNAIAPGWVMTERQLAKARLQPHKVTEYLSRQCLKKHLEPSDIAEMALWLCSDESRLCSGQVFTVDAGAS